MVGDLKWKAHQLEVHCSWADWPTWPGGCDVSSGDVSSHWAPQLQPGRGWRHWPRFSMSVSIGMSYWGQGNQWKCRALQILQLYDSIDDTTWYNMKEHCIIITCHIIYNHRYMGTGQNRLVITIHDHILPYITIFQTYITIYYHILPYWWEYSHPAIPAMTEGAPRLRIVKISTRCRAARNKLLLRLRPRSPVPTSFGAWTPSWFFDGDLMLFMCWFNVLIYVLILCLIMVNFMFC